MLLKVLQVLIMKQSEDKTKYDNFYSSSKAEVIINESNIDDVFQWIFTLAGRSYIKFLKEIDHTRKALINIQNTDYNECFKWSIVRYLNPSDHNPRKFTKADKDFTK